MSSALRNFVALALVSAAVALGAPGCSQQGEGERCDNGKNGDADCESGLTCVVKSQLLEGITDRCCPAAGTESDKRCTRGTSQGSTGGSSNNGSGGDDPGDAGERSASGSSSGGSAGTNAGGSAGTNAGGMSGGGAASDAGAAGTPVEASAGNGAGGAG